MTITKALTDEQREEVLRLYKEAKTSEDSLEEFGGKDAQHWKKDSKMLKIMDYAWRNSGKLPGSDQRVGIEDLFKKDRDVTHKMRDSFSTDHPLLIPRVISNMAREAIEPQLVLTPLLSRITHNAGTRVVFPAWGALRASDIAEGAEYPEQSLELAGEVTAVIGKSGVAVKVTEEQIRYNQFDLLAMHVRAAGRALARHKEQKVANLILNNGTTLMDNNSAGVKSTTGRSADGSYNGTLTLDDLYFAHATMVDTGFTPNTLIMHPFAWQIFAQEGIARAFGFINGMNSLMWQTPQGQPGNASPWRMGELNQNTYTSSPQNIASTFTNVPSIFPTMYNIIISPFMHYDATNSLTDIVMCDVAELGILVVDEEVTTDQWTDVARDIEKIKFRERYGLAIQNDGKAVGLIKGVKIAKSFDFSDKISTNIDLTGLGDALTGDPDFSNDLGLD